MEEMLPLLYRMKQKKIVNNNNKLILLKHISK